MPTTLYDADDNIIFRLGDTIRLFDSRGESYAISGVVNEISESIVINTADELQADITLQAKRIRENVGNGTYTLQVIESGDANIRVLLGSFDDEDLARCSHDNLLFITDRMASTSMVNGDVSKLLLQLRERLNTALL